MRLVNLVLLAACSGAQRLGRSALVLLVVTLAGCGSGDPGSVDASAADAAIRADAAALDAAALDAAVLDAAISADAAALDAAVLDAAVPDAAVPDAAPPDAAPPDAVVPDAAPPCGCVEGQYCDTAGVCRDDLGPLGAYCGPTTACAPDDVDYPDCMDTQCLSYSCGVLAGVFFLRNACTRPCEIRKDVEAPYGVEDPDAVSDCQPPAVWDGPVGTGYHCVNHAQPAHVVNAYCVAGSDFRTCASNADCPADEVCDLSGMGGEVALRCIARYRESAAWAGSVVRLGEGCNNEPADGPLVFCADGLCLATDYCSAFCTDDADCDTTLVTAGQRCVDFACENGGAACTTDLDCSTSACTGSTDLGGLSVTYCMPKS